MRSRKLIEIKLLEKGIKDSLRISDGRMSGWIWKSYYVL